MATLEGHMSKLQAVNDMLWSIGEMPVQSLASGLGDAEQAESILDRVSRQVQLKGWHVNTLRDYELSKNVDDQFVLPVNTLRVDTTNPRGGWRRSSTPPHSARINAIMKRSEDDTKWLMYDGDNNTETWTDSDPATLNVDIVLLLEFANLTPALQMYVWTMAAHRFQKGAMTSQVIQNMTEEDIAEAMIQAVQEDTMNEDQNIINDNGHVNSVAWRNNPLYGR
jgi:hypothetical protein